MTVECRATGAANVMLGLACTRTCSEYPEDPARGILRPLKVHAAMRSYWTYILANKPRGTLYVGVTNGLIRRIEQHRAGTASAFTRRYGGHSLVWYEEFPRARDAIQREKSLKRYNRDWKINLIERTNPHWEDLYPTLPGVAPLTLLLPRGTLDPRPEAEDDG